MKKFVRLLALVLTIAMVATGLVACGGGSSDGGDSGDGGAATGEAKDTLVVLSSEAFSGSFDPAGHTVLSNVHLQEAVFDYLVKLNYETKELEPCLATEWEQNDDGYSVTFKLREGVKFHDGSDFTADDVKASVEWMSRADSARGADWGEPYTADVIDDYTVRIYPVCEEPRAPLMNLLTYYECPIMSADDIEGGNLTAGLNGTGPYKFMKYEDETCFLDINEEYWDTEHAASIPHIEYRYVPESQTRLAALQSGEADLIERVETEQIPQIESTEGLEYIGAPVYEQKYLVFKCTQAPMDNPLLRKAIAYAIDVDTIVDNIMEGYGTKADSWLAHVNTNYTAWEEFPTYDPEKAKELLAEAGYPNGEGLPTLKYITSTGFYPKTKEYAEYVVSNLNDIGINVDLEVQESGAWSESLYAEDSCHMIDTGWMIGNEDNEEIAACFNAPHGLMDFSTDETVFAAIAKETGEMDPDARKAIIHDELWPALNDSMSTFPLFDSYMIWAYNSNLKGFKPYPTSNIEFHELSFGE